jgi:hypothetical protein
MLTVEDREGDVYQALLADVGFHQLLLNFDHDMADTAREQGCPCGGVLHSARYRRKPRGLPAGLDKKAYCWRFSFCCAVDGCRQRNTPRSLRFLGRRVYLATMVVLISVMQHGATPKRVAQLSQLFGVSDRTIARWRQWWRTRFAESRFWQARRAALMPPVDHQRLPASLLERFAGGGAEQLMALLRFLAPLTGGAALHAW